jgi:putative addiction module killer protein
MFEVRHYLTSDGENLFLSWLKGLRDPKAKVAAIRRTNRIEQGNFGDHKSIGEGVWELRLVTGPGYRIYYAKSDKTVVLLLCAGKKASQERDIADAKTAWKDWQKRQPKETQQDD